MTEKQIENAKALELADAMQEATVTIGKILNPDHEAHKRFKYVLLIFDDDLNMPNWISNCAAEMVASVMKQTAAEIEEAG